MLVENRVSTEQPILINPLIYSNVLTVKDSERVVIDDLSGVAGSYEQYVQELGSRYPQLKMMTSDELNAQVAKLLQEYLPLYHGARNTTDFEPDAVAYISPGGGGQRMRTSLNTLGYDTTRAIQIETDRDKTTRQAQVKRQSIPYMLESLEGAQYIVILDDAINGGGTLDAIINQIKQDGRYQNIPIFSATQIRFANAQNVANETVGGVNDCITLAACVVVGSDDAKPADLTYLSSFAKKDVDPRLAQIAGSDSAALLQLQQLMNTVKKQYWQDVLGVSEQIPQTPEFESLVDLLCSIVDPDIMRRLLADSLTNGEMIGWAHRVQAAQLLVNGNSVAEVAQSTGLSVETTERIYRWVLYGTGGYKDGFFTQRAEGNVAIDDYSI